MRGDYAEIPPGKFIAQALHFSVQCFGFFFIAKTFSVRRIAQNKPGRVWCGKFSKVCLHKIRARNFCITSYRLKGASCHNAGIFCILAASFYSRAINIASGDADFYVRADKGCFVAAYFFGAARIVDW